MHYISKTRGDRFIIRALMRRLANWGYETDKQEIQSKSGLTRAEFEQALQRLLAEEVVKENVQGQLSLTTRGVMCYEVARTLTFA